MQKKKKTTKKQTNQPNKQNLWEIQLKCLRRQTVLSTLELFRNTFIVSVQITNNS